MVAGHGSVHLASGQQGGQNTRRHCHGAPRLCQGNAIQFTKSSALRNTTVYGTILTNQYIPYLHSYINDNAVTDAL